MTPLQQVRELIAAAPDELTDMSKIGNPKCGSPGCIIGWTVGVPDSDDPEACMSAFRDARRILGLTETQADNLCLGNFTAYDIRQLGVTKDETLAAIDSMIADPTREMPEWPDHVIRAVLGNA